MDGYISGIIYSIGSMSDGRMCIRNVERWYCDIVQPEFGSKVYAQGRTGREKPQYTIKSHDVKPVRLGDVSDVSGFCRAYIELHGLLDMRMARNGSGRRVRRLRLRVYGQEDAIEFIMTHLPAKRKKIQRISSVVDGKYRGETCAIYYQSKKEIMDILEYIDGEPRNERVWENWRNTWT